MPFATIYPAQIPTHLCSNKEPTHSRIHTALNKRRLPARPRSSDQPEEQTHGIFFRFTKKRHHNTTAPQHHNHTGVRTGLYSDTGCALALEILPEIHLTNTITTFAIRITERASSETVWLW